MEPLHDRYLVRLPPVIVPFDTRLYCRIYPPDGTRAGSLWMAEHHWIGKPLRDAQEAGLRFLEQRLPPSFHLYSNVFLATGLYETPGDLPGTDMGPLGGPLALW